MVVSDDGKDDNGQKKENEKGGGEELTEVPVSDEKSRRRLSDANAGQKHGNETGEVDGQGEHQNQFHSRSENGTLD